MTTILNTMTSKKDDYKSSLITNQDLLKSTAHRMAINGSLESNLLSMIKSDEGDNIFPEDDIKSFMEEQRQRIKNLAEQNALRERKIDNFIGAINQLKVKVATDGAAELGGGEAKYESVIADLMQQEEDNHPMDAKTSEMYIDICDKLGEKVKRPGTAAGDDDDIEIVRNNTATEQNYKCPMTSKLMEDPVKNKVCGHVYSREGIDVWMKSRRNDHPCPVTGCTNQSVTPGQLEDDAFTARLVKRYKRQQDKETEQRAMSQAHNLEDSDDDDEMN